MRRPAVLTLAAATAAAALSLGGASAASGPAHPGNGHGGKVRCDSLILTTFDFGTPGVGGEIGPYQVLNRKVWQQTDGIPGAYRPLWSKRNGVCVTTTGTGKTNAAASLAAVLDSPQLGGQRPYLIPAGIAGTRALHGGTTLGSVGIAPHIIDVDLGFVTNTRESALPNGWDPLDTYDNSVYATNGRLAAYAVRVGRTVQLDNGDAKVQAERDLYPEQAGHKANVTLCDSVGSDQFFAGRLQADKWDTIQANRVRQLGPGHQPTDCHLSDFEDPAFAEVADRHGYTDPGTGELQRFVDVRGASDLEDQPSGESADFLMNHFPGFVISANNTAAVALAVATALAH